MRPRLLRIPHDKQVFLTQLLSTFDMALVLFHQPSKEEAREAARKTDRSPIHVFVMTPMLLRSAPKKRNGGFKIQTPTEGYTQAAIGPLLPASR